MTKTYQFTVPCCETCPVYMAGLSFFTEACENCASDAVLRYCDALDYEHWQIDADREKGIDVYTLVDPDMTSALLVEAVRCGALVKEL